MVEIALDSGRDKRKTGLHTSCGFGDRHLMSDYRTSSAVQVPANLVLNWVNYPAALVDVGSRTGNGETQGLYGGDRCEGLLLRSVESLAPWHERKHQPAAAAILPARHRPIPIFNVQERSWDFKLRRVNCKQVLRRPSEPAAIIGHQVKFRPSAV